MQNASGNIQEALNEDFSPEESSQSLSHKARVYTRILTGVCVSIWFASFFAFLGAEWLYTLQQPELVKVVPRPPQPITFMLRGSGSLALLAGIGGWWAALHHRHGFLFTFSCITLLTSVVEISCGSVTLSYLGKTALLMYEDVVRDLQQIRKPDANETTEKFLELQKELHCCGVNSYHDWLVSPWWKSQRNVNSNFVVPQSCCISTPQVKNCHTGKPPFRELDYPGLLHKEASGLLIIAVGVFVNVDLNDAGVLIGTVNYLSANLLFFISGGTVVIFTVIGCFGYFFKKRVVLCVFTYSVMLVFVVQCVISAMSFTWMNEVHYVVEAELLKFFREGAESNHTTSEKFEAMNLIQVRFQCCGANNYTDWENSSWLPIDNSTGDIPISCCKEHLSVHACTEGNVTEINTKGCILPLTGKYKQNYIIMGSSAIVASLFQFILFHLSNYLMFNIE